MIFLKGNFMTTIQLVLGFGADCKVLEPEWLRDEVARQGEAIAKMYK